MSKRNRGKKKKKKAVSGKPAEAAEEAMLHLPPALPNEEAMLHLSPALPNEEAMLNPSPSSSEEALLDPTFSPNNQGEDNLLNQAIGMSGATFLRSQDDAAANVVGNWNLDEDAVPGGERNEEGTMHNLLPTILVGTRTVMSATSQVSTPMLVLGIAQPMTMAQRANNTSLATSRVEEGGPNDPNNDVDYGAERDDGKEEMSPPRSLEHRLELRTITPRTKASKVLKQSDFVRLVATKGIRLRTSGLNHNPQQRVEIMNADGVYEYSDEELAGYLSPGESTYRIQAGLLDLVIKAAHAEMPNTAVIKAKQEAYDKVIQTSEEMLAKQRQDYQAQCDRMLQEHQVQGERMAADHKRCMEQMRRENEEMLAEAARMRQEYAKPVVLNYDSSIEDVKRTQARYYDEDIEK
jgi:hypothetical protein